MGFSDQGLFARNGPCVWRQHPLVVLPRLVLGVVATVFLLIVGMHLFSPVGWVLPIFPFAWTLRQGVIWYSYTIRLQPEGLTICEGVIRHHKQVIQIQQIKSLDTEQPLLCRLCNAGHVKIITGPDLNENVVRLRWIHPMDRFDRCYGAIQSKLSEAATSSPVEIVVRHLPAEPTEPAQLPAPGDGESKEEPEPSDVIEVPYREVPVSKRRRRLRRASSEQQGSTRLDSEQGDSEQQERLPPASKRRRRLRR